jgi:TetR/AcrR family transcriptional regulator
MPKKKNDHFIRARRPGQIEERLETILDAAMTLFREKGLENVTLTDIGLRAGTAKSNLYRYFESREHIYLVTLQKVAADWEKDVRAQLQKLGGRGTVASVSEVITDSFLRAEHYSTLITVINTVLEKKLAPRLVANFRRVFLERRQRFSRDLAAALPGMSAEKLFPLTLHIFTQVVGLWPLCHPSPASQKMLAEPEFVHLNLNFKVEMSNFLHLLLKS